MRGSSMHYYRYVDRAEEIFIRASDRIESLSGVTFFAVCPPSCYSTRAEVAGLLAVPVEKTVRVGPVFDNHIPASGPGGGQWFVAPRTVAPQQLPDGTWAHGGGTEAATDGPVMLVEYARLQ